MEESIVIISSGAEPKLKNYLSVMADGIEKTKVREKEMTIITDEKINGEM